MADTAFTAVTVFPAGRFKDTVTLTTDGGVVIEVRHQRTPEVWISDGGDYSASGAHVIAPPKHTPIRVTPISGSFNIHGVD